MWPFNTPPLGWIATVKILNKITYKPNVSIGWMALDSPDFVLRISARVPHADKKDEMATVGTSHVLKHMTEEQVVRDVMRCLIALETHEAQEFFRYDGKKVFDPHNRVPMDLIRGF